MSINDNSSGNEMSGIFGTDHANPHRSSSNTEVDRREHKSISQTSVPSHRFVFPILFFIGLSIWGALELSSNLQIGYTIEIGFIVAIVSLLVGILLRNLLLILFKGILLVGIIAVLAVVGYHFFDVG